MLDQESDEDRFADLANIVFDQAHLAEGGQLDDPAAYVSRLNKLLLEMSKGCSCRCVLPATRCRIRETFGSTP